MGLMPEALTIQEMLEAEAEAIRKGWSEERLLETAGKHLGTSIHHLEPHSGTAIAYIGKGHNGGDALVALRLLRDKYGWQVAYRPAFPIKECAPLVQQHAMLLGEDSELSHAPDLAALPRPLILIDGLLGTGSKGTPRPPLDSLIGEISELRQRSGAKVISVDLPSGVDADSGVCAEGAVTADMTLMIANAKAGLLKSCCCNHTGGLAIVPLEALARSGSSGVELIAPQTLDIGKAPRAHGSHKGSSGKVSLLVGSDSYPGAAALAATGALRGGAGLVFVHVPHCVLETVRKLSPPEVIVSGYERIDEVPVADADSRVVGCGLGSLDESQWNSLRDWISASDLPTVIDADALNAISHHDALGLTEAYHVLTPHPGEFTRMAPALAKLDREDAAQGFIQQHAATLLLKGSRSLIAQSGKSLRCNSTGHAGMASGGQGDLLAGVIGALLAYGESPFDAASLGAWLCGRAAELTLVAEPPQSKESLTASDTSIWLGQAWRDWHDSRR